MTTANQLIGPALVLACLCCLPCEAQLSGSADETGLRMQGDGIACSVGARGEISVTAGGLTYTLSGLQARRDKLAVVPIGEMVSAEVTRDGADEAAGAVVLAFAEGPRVVLRVRIQAGVAAVRIESEMTNLGEDALNRDKWSWYHWSFAHGADRYESPVEGNVVSQPMSNGATLPFDQWLFIRRRDGSGGLGVLSRYRMSSDKSTAFIWGSARSMDCVLAPAKDAASAQAALDSLGGIESMRAVPTIEYAGHGAEYYGAPAPEWLHRAEVFNFLYPTWADMTRWQSPEYFPLLLFSDRIAWPKEGGASDFIERSHKAGLRIIPYVCFSELSSVPGARGYYNDLMDIPHHLDDWVCLDKEGKCIVSPWGRQTNQPNLYAMCMNAEGFREAVLAAVKKLMDSGIDGLFIDNVGSFFALGCNAEKLGRHKHVDATAAAGELYGELAADIYRLVKSYGDDRIVMHNGGLSWAACDSQMTESFMYHFEGSAEPKRYTADELYALVSLWEEARRYGKLAAPLCYTSRVAADKRKDANYHTYAAVKLAGALYSNWLNPKAGDPGDAATLYRVRLGLPTGDIGRSGDILFRTYERGVVAVNAGEEQAEAELPVPFGGLRDLYSGETLDVADGRLKRVLPAQSGRVYAAQ